MLSIFMTRTSLHIINRVGKKDASYLLMSFFSCSMLELWCLTPLSTIFQLHHVAVSFIGGGNRSIRRKPAAKNLITV